MRPLVTALVVLLTPPTLAPARAAGAPPGEVFRDLSFENALLEAGKTDRLVMVDFFTTWCGPCKRLDEVTWTDAAVRAWLAENTVALKVDAEQEVELARTYTVAAYPTLLFVQPDGKERGRIVGFKDATGFLEAASDAVRGIRPSQRAREKLQGGEANSPMLRQEYADTLAREGKHAEALEEYLWCFDHGLEHGPSYVGVRLSFLLRSIVDLGSVHPPALEALEGRRDERSEDILQGSGSVQQVRDVAAINRVLGESDRTLELFDRLAEVEGLTEARRLELRRGMSRSIVDLLLEKRRYEDVLELGGDLERELAMELLQYRRLEESDSDAHILSITKRITLDRLVRNYEALVGSKTRDAQARAYAARIFEFDATPSTREALMERARKAGRADAAEELSRLDTAAESRTEDS